MKKVYFIMGIHNHQPIGNFDYIMDHVYTHAYFPFLETIKRHPHIKICLHYSGILWDWLKENKPQMIELCHQLLVSQQIELLSGGYYEPLLSIIPDQDKMGQLSNMNQFLYNTFNVKPRGLWLTERVWEPSLPKYIYNAHQEYLAVDDLHFLAAGLNDEDLHGYYLTEDEGKVIKLFPGRKKLRYTIPFKHPQETIDFLYQIGKNENCGDLAMMADDGEKFGVWPCTYNRVYKEGWLETFFSLIEENKDWLCMCTCAEYIDSHRPLGRIYLPSISYAEMEEWTQSPSSIETYHRCIEWVSKKCADQQPQKYIRGGTWRNFLGKYSEAHNLYSKMLEVSAMVNREIEYYKKEKGNPLPDWLIDARDELYKGQCNDAFWHGLFGGVYSPHLRFSIYEHLIRAQNKVDTHNAKDNSWIKISACDLNQDGFQEIQINTDQFIVYVSPNEGGSIYELDFRPLHYNVVNSLIRRNELYHKHIAGIYSKETESTNDATTIKTIHEIVDAKEEGLDSFLFYDSYPRNCLLDHFFSCNTTLNNFKNVCYNEYGDFIKNAYEFSYEKPNGNSLILKRSGKIEIDNKCIEAEIKKILYIIPAHNIIDIEYRIKNLSSMVLECVFGIEFNQNLLAGNASSRYYQINGEYPTDPRLASAGELKNVHEILMIDEYMKLKIGMQLSEVGTLWRFPIETVSNSESGYERVYQSSVIFPHWNLLLLPEETKTYTLKWIFNQLL
ncbi:MAG: alpha-amylase/4-alpha-glucanotransferase domain-containing protein [bacterium]